MPTGANRARIVTQLSLRTVGCGAAIGASGTHTRLYPDKYGPVAAPTIVTIDVDDQQQRSTGP